MSSTDIINCFSNLSLFSKEEFKNELLYACPAVGFQTEKSGPFLDHNKSVCNKCVTERVSQVDHQF